MKLQSREIPFRDWQLWGNYLGVPIKKAKSNAIFSLLLMIPPVITFILIDMYWQGDKFLLAIPVFLFLILDIYILSLMLDVLVLYSPVVTEITELTYKEWFDVYNTISDKLDTVIQKDFNSMYDTLMKMALADIVVKSDKAKAGVISGVLNIEVLDAIDEEAGKAHIYIESYFSKYCKRLLTFKVYAQKDDDSEAKVIYEMIQTM